MNPPPGLFVDLYELAMARAYLREGLTDEAVFSLFARDLPPRRNFLLACGIDDALAVLEGLSFGDDDLAYLRTLGRFDDDFLGWLRGFRFTGTVRAVAEGTPVFAGEPALEVAAPLPEAQIVETALLERLHLPTVAASKAARVVAAARGRPVVDFGARRTHGFEAHARAARAFRIAGVSATSDLLAGRTYGLPVTGTMAHSYVQAHDDEAEAFRAYASIYPETALLVDTYDALEGVRKVAALGRERGEAFRVRAIRLDSGDLDALSREARRILDEAGLERVGILASGGLDEDSIDLLVSAGAPIDGFGVGTRLGVSADAPAVEFVYKIVAYAGRERAKRQAGKETLPGPKQVFRLEAGGEALGDVVGRADERLAGRPLLREVMRGGRRVAPPEDVEAVRRRAAEEVARLPARVRALSPADPPYPVETSAGLSHLRSAPPRRSPTWPS